MDNPFENIFSDSRFRLVAELADLFGIQAFLVGGGLRDAVMERTVRDFDFVLSGADEELPRELASRTGGHFFRLDRERRQSRVVTGKRGESFTFDFAPMRGRDLYEDLALRDFTINSLALPVTREMPSVVDPLGGLKDIEQGRIRACSARSFDDDPLRLLRAIRFAATLGFGIDGGTWQEMVKRPALLGDVAGERIREEFFLILEAQGIVRSLEMLRYSGLLYRILPLDGHRHGASDDDDRRIARAAEAERVMDNLQLLFPDDGNRLLERLRQRIESGITLSSLVKLAAYLAGEGAERRIMLCGELLRLGTKARAELQSLCRCAFSFPDVLSEKSGERILFRYFRDREPAGPELLLLPLVNHALSSGLAARLVSYYFHCYRATEKDLLLSGIQVMALLGIGQGPALGAALETLRQAETAGQVATEAEARDFLVKNQLTKQGPVG